MLYDPEANIMCIEVSTGKISHTRELRNFIIHSTKTEKPVLIEILDASKFIGQVDSIKNISKLKNIRKIIPNPTN